MKIAFVTESGFKGKIPRNFPNCRTEYAWQIALDADHYPINDLPTGYNLVIVILPKKNFQSCIGIIAKLKSGNDKVAVMQEGPHWYYQDYPLHLQIEYINMLVESDIIFVHNSQDKVYYKGLTDHHDIRIMQSLMIEDSIEVKKLVTPNSRRDVIIGGNFVSWYGGMDSFIVAKELQEKESSINIWAPSMGRMVPGEDELLKHLPYVEWNKWIFELSSFKYAVHLMRTHAAGTFALNCAFLSLPCICYTGLDTSKLHPHLSVDIGDLVTAKKLIHKLQNDKDFYNICSEESNALYKQLYNEEIFLKKFHNLF